MIYQNRALTYTEIPRGNAVFDRQQIIRFTPGPKAVILLSTFVKRWIARPQKR